MIFQYDWSSSQKKNLSTTYQPTTSVIFRSEIAVFEAENAVLSGFSWRKQQKKPPRPNPCFRRRIVVYLYGLVEKSEHSTNRTKLLKMNDLILSKVEEKIITLRQQQVTLANDVAELYGVETREVVQAIKNNPDKFPEGYVFNITSSEKEEVIKIFDNLSKLRFSPSLPKAFTEKGLYMLATILKSPQALKFRRWRGRGNTEEITRKFLNVSRIMHCTLCIAHYALTIVH